MSSAPVVPTTSVDGRATSVRRAGDGFTLSQLVVAVAVTHVVTLLFYVAVAAICYWRRSSRTLRGPHTNSGATRPHSEQQFFPSSSSWYSS